MKNHYHDINVDIAACHRRLNDEAAILLDRLERVGRWSRLLHRWGVYERLVDSGLIRYWFDEFSRFWGVILGGRSLRFHDFFFLYGHYRSRFQDVAVGEDSDMEQFLAEWQRRENIYLAFAAAYRDALDPFTHRLYLPYVRSGNRILEYGCGVAPIVTSFLRAGMNTFHYTIADIQNYTFAYAKWRLLKQGVECVDLIPGASPPLSGSYDVVFLMTVLEHLPDPLAVIEELTRRLASGGRLVFDYILGKGEGLDTAAGIEQRAAVLEYMEQHYHILKGELKAHESMGTTVLVKQ